MERRQMFPGGVRLYTITGSIDFLSSHVIEGDKEGVIFTRYSRALIGGQSIDNLDVAPDVERLVQPGSTGTFWLATTDGRRHAILAAATSDGCEAVTERMLRRWMRPLRALGTYITVGSIPMFVLAIGVPLFLFGIWMKVKGRKIERSICDAALVAASEARAVTLSKVPSSSLAG